MTQQAGHNQSRSLQPSCIQQSVSLADKNWFRTGGTARFYAEPVDATGMQQAVAFANDNNLPLFMLGQGANILISDEGFDGLTIRPQLQHISCKQEDDAVYVTAGAGVTMHELIDYCLAHHALGLEEFSGIPGTVGGSIYINLHYFEFLLEQFLDSAQILDRATGNLETVPTGWFNFGYNFSTLHAHKHFLVEATFKLKKGSSYDVAFAQGRRQEIIRHRAKRYPATHTCGSFFRNFFEHEVSLESNGKKIIFVAYYLDKIGVKGQLRVGDAIVSHQHANMLVNCGKATSSDIIQLARRMQELVVEHFNIVPQPECQLIGFNNYPLL